MTNHGVDDEQWAEFVRNHQASTGLAAPAEAGQASGGTKKGRNRAGLVLGALVALGVAGLGTYGLLSGPKKTASVTVLTPSSARPSAPASAAPSSPAPSASAAAPTFGPQYAGYTLVTDAARTDCTSSETVGPTLAGLLTQSHGCLGVHQALYKDAAGDQFNLAMFTMKDPADLAHVITQLAGDATDVEVGTIVPSADSGLRQLPADAGMVQSFAGYGPTLLIGVGEWSDGHVGDYNTLVSKLSPLLDSVMKGSGGDKPITT
ncbi:hypothetical protein ACFW1A_20395 [Kitasatospora sp. NPDC058965]|uniref:hypothetical protein n=1 Tax=Kitasatospora sp. NPDC058965 TaxID=3346682 RepID=UPI003675C083